MQQFCSASTHRKFPARVTKYRTSSGITLQVVLVEIVIIVLQVGTQSTRNAKTRDSGFFTAKNLKTAAKNCVITLSKFTVLLLAHSYLLLVRVLLQVLVRSSLFLHQLFLNSNLLQIFFKPKRIFVQSGEYVVSHILYGIPYE